jgi:hypothetical protein
MVAVPLRVPGSDLVGLDALSELVVVRLMEGVALASEDSDEDQVQEEDVVAWEVGVVLAVGLQSPRVSDDVSVKVPVTLHDAVASSVVDSDTLRVVAESETVNWMDWVHDKSGDTVGKTVEVGEGVAVSEALAVRNKVTVLE